MKFFESMVESLMLYFEHIFEPQFLTTILIRLVQIILMLVFVRIILRFLNAVIDKVILGNQKTEFFDVKKVTTLSTLLKSVFKYLIYFFVFWNILKLSGFPTESILAAAGIGGLAFGFGAQNLARDVITGSQRSHWDGDKSFKGSNEGTG